MEMFNFIVAMFLGACCLVLLFLCRKFLADIWDQQATILHLEEGRKRDAARIQELESCLDYLNSGKEEKT